HGDGSAHPALPDLLPGIHGACRRGVCPGRGAARRARILRRVGWYESPLARQGAPTGAPRLPGTGENDRRGARRRCGRGDRSARRGNGRRGPMTFHPRMAYDAAFHKSARPLEEEGPPFTYTEANRARLEEILKRYPPDRRRSAVMPALYLVREQQGYITA